MPDCIAKPFVHLAVDAVDTVLFDPQGHFDAERYDHYESFAAARDAALSSIEIMLDLEDYDGEDHREELVRMQRLLESCSCHDELACQSDYQRLLDRLGSAKAAAA